MYLNEKLLYLLKIKYFQLHKIKKEYVFSIFTSGKNMLM